jgi:hypothetical protein
VHILTHGTNSAFVFRTCVNLFVVCLTAVQHYMKALFVYPLKTGFCVHCTLYRGSDRTAQKTQFGAVS